MTEITSIQADRGRNGQTLYGLRGKARGLPEDLKELEAHQQALQILQSGPNIISKRIHLATARGMRVFFKEGEEGINGNHEQSSRESATL